MTQAYSRGQQLIKLLMLLPLLLQASRKIGRARLLLMAPDITRSRTAAVDPLQLVEQVLKAAIAACVPVVFALSRRCIGPVGQLQPLAPPL